MSQKAGRHINELIESHHSNKLAAYHQVIRDNFNYGNNRYLLDFNHRNWLFDNDLKPVYAMCEPARSNWIHSGAANSVFVASKGIDPLHPEKYVQRTGLCLIESSEIKILTNKTKDGSFLSERDAISIMNAYPTESQIHCVKPVLTSDVVVYLEDFLFEELWDRFTNGAYSQSRNMQDAFNEQIERTISIVERYVRAINPQSVPKIKVVRYSDIRDPLQKEVSEWVNELLGQKPYSGEGDEKFYIPNAAMVLYSYGGKNLAKISGLDESKEMILVRPISHCVLEKGWTKNKSRVMDWFRDAVVTHYITHPKQAIGYLDLFDNQGGCCYKDTYIEKKVHFGELQKHFLEKSLARPFPLWENRVFQRGVMCDNHPDVFNSMLHAGLLNSSFVFSGRPENQKEEVKRGVRKDIERIYEIYAESILPLFEKK